MATFTGDCAHLQTSVPPAKFADPAFTPWSTDGWILIASDIFLAPPLVSA
jgi:hypothetical protein